MEIAVLVKQVPDTEIVPKVKPDNSGVSTDNINKFVINPYDEYAITLACDIAKTHSGTNITVVTLGTDKAQESIRRALAMGAHTGVLLKTDSDFVDGVSTANVISEYLKTKTFNLVIAGKKSVDLDQGIVGPSVSAQLGFPVACGVKSFALSQDAKIATIAREVEEGEEVVDISLPCVVTCEKGLNDPKPPSLPNIMQAKKKPLEILEAKLTDSGIKITKVEEPPVRTAVKMISGEIREQASAVAKILKEEFKII